MIETTVSDVTTNLTFRLPAESPGEFEVGLALRMLTAVSEAPAEPPTGQGPARPSRLLVPNQTRAI